MDARDTTANNTDLWTRYLEDQWLAWLDSLGLHAGGPDEAAARAIAETTAANVASLLQVVAASPIGQLFDANAAHVTRFLQDAAIAPDSTVIPEEFSRATTPPPPATTQRDWSPMWETPQAPAYSHTHTSN